MDIKSRKDLFKNANQPLHKLTTLTNNYQSNIFFSFEGKEFNSVVLNFKRSPPVRAKEEDSCLEYSMLEKEDSGNEKKVISSEKLSPKMETFSHKKEFQQKELIIQNEDVV
ncbi:hypothetical protein CDAR_589791 [Caerostris darwini]|uniref:Uncharacterized protein n=1 Tax=Caerostris darwini TaxID=1538125 RepID=A0AAV4PIL1_9ARAC|nr:hypothetical protein CDAR_589791 [Caerostris darwini]